MLRLSLKFTWLCYCLFNQSTVVNHSQFLGKKSEACKMDSTWNNEMEQYLILCCLKKNVFFGQLSLAVKNINIMRIHNENYKWILEFISTLMEFIEGNLFSLFRFTQALNGFCTTKLEWSDQLAHLNNTLC